MKKRNYPESIQAKINETRRQIILTAVLTIGFACVCRANYVNIENAGVHPHESEESLAGIRFDISWENSWRNEINHDAAWVFFKGRKEGDVEWRHITLSGDGINEQLDGFSRGEGTEIDIIVPSDRMGMFIRRSGEGKGAVEVGKVTAAWEPGAHGWSASDNIHVRVLAVEMVYVAEGPFFVGSGGMDSGSLTDSGWEAGNTLPFEISSEDVLMISSNAPGFLWGTSISGNSKIGPEGELPAAFPKGYAAFYCMKYSITQGQYADFLNLLTPGQAENRFPDEYGNFRHTIRLEDGVYKADAPSRACNYISWVDGVAYAQWSGLRPMTELEYEKACRGTAPPVPGEFAWGNTNIVQQTGHDETYGADGSGLERALPPNANACYGNHRHIQGPVRVGIYAVDNADRESAGAGFWGILDLSGNLWEQAVSVGIPRGREFEGSHGNGVLSKTGFATKSDWPGLHGEEITFSFGAGFRGGAWSNFSVGARVSARHFAAPGGTGGRSRSNRFGWRGVRTAPPWLDQ